MFQLMEHSDADPDAGTTLFCGLFTPVPLRPRLIILHAEITDEQGVASCLLQHLLPPGTELTLANLECPTRTQVFIFSLYDRPTQAQSKQLSSQLFTQRRFRALSGSSRLRPLVSGIQGLNWGGREVACSWRTQARAIAALHFLSGI